LQDAKSADQDFHVKAGLVPAISIWKSAAPQPIGITGTSPVMTESKRLILHTIPDLRLRSVRDDA
jgi:hypothetical protein